MMNEPQTLKLGEYVVEVDTPKLYISDVNSGSAENEISLNAEDAKKLADFINDNLKQTFVFK